MYGLKDIQRGVENPYSAVRELHRLYYTRGGKYEVNPHGTGIFDYDWDNLIILDACRYDTFESLANLPGESTFRRTLDGATHGFVPANFTNQKLHDLVYVTANSWFLELRNEINSEVHKLIDLHYGDTEGEYNDDEFGIVMPKTMTNCVRNTAERYPNKRLIAHYIQPHYPFIGETGQKFTQKTDNLREIVNSVDDEETDAIDLVREAYRENLESVLPEVEKLLTTLPGKTAVTADHGELLGEQYKFLPVRGFGHHSGIYCNELTKVPWHTSQNGPRKDIVAEEPQERTEVDDERLSSRLEHLGYKM